jgi:fructose-1,6-bisphosphatase/inositol monophosphatase family enzyme
MDAPTFDQLFDFGREMHRRYLRIAAGGPGPRPLRPGDHATRVDRDLELALVELVEASFGVAGIVAEERVSDGAGILNPAATLRAYIDPIDGTHLYNRGVPGFTSTVGFELDGRLCGGVIYTPTTRVLRIARRGEPSSTVAVDGSTLDDRPVGAPDRQVVAVKSGLRRSAPAVERTLSDRGYRVENLGSVANRLDAVATGRIAGLVKDVRTTQGIARLWGVAAGLQLCEDAGVSMFWDEGNRILVVGEQGIADSLVTERVCRVAARDLDSLWHAMKARDQL